MNASTFDDFVRARGRAFWRAAFLLTGDAHLVATAMPRYPSAEPTHS